MSADQQEMTLQALSLPICLVTWLKEAKTGEPQSLTSLISGALVEYLDAGPNGGAVLLSESDGRIFRQVALLARAAVFPGVHLKHEFPTTVDAETLLADPRNAALYAIALEEMQACRAELSLKKRRRTKRKKKTAATKSHRRRPMEGEQATKDPFSSSASGSPNIEQAPDEMAAARQTRSRRGRKAKEPLPTDQLPLF